MNDHCGAALMLAQLPPARELIGDRGYDSDAFRAALRARSTTPASPHASTAGSPSRTTLLSTNNAIASR